MQADRLFYLKTAVIFEPILYVSSAVSLLYVFLVGQVLTTRKRLKSTAWNLLALAFIFGSLRQIWTVLALLETLKRERNLGLQVPTSNQWISVILAVFLVSLSVAGFEKLRRDLRKIGV